MKRVVLCDDLREDEIRPEPLYREYQALLESDSQALFQDKQALIAVNCPGCEGRPVVAFERWGAQYCRCPACDSLFVSPRPSEGRLGAFYQESGAVRFWRQKFTTATAEARNHRLFQPRFHWLLSVKDQYCPSAEVVVDYHSKYPGFLETLCNSGEFRRVAILRPDFGSGDWSMPAGIEQAEEPQRLNGQAGLFTAFEVLERLFDPRTFLNQAREVCLPGGILVLTTTTCSGFEYQVLGAHAPNLNPPDRLNLFSIETLTRMLEECGFELLELSTPGRLDVEIVRKTLEANPELPVSSFWRYFFQHRGEGARHSLQEFLQQYQLSSHVRVAARKG